MARFFVISSNMKREKYESERPFERMQKFWRQQSGLQPLVIERRSALGGLAEVLVVVREGEPNRLFEDGANGVSVILDGSPQIGPKHLGAEELVQLYLKSGPEAMARDIDGGWTAIILDERSKQILAVRDRIGLKPVYYHHSKEQLIISSSAGAIIRGGWIRAEGNDNSIARYSSHHYRVVYGLADSFFKGIQLLAPSTILITRNGRIDLLKYWDLEPTQAFHQMEEDQLKEMYRQKHLSMIRNYVRPRQSQHIAVALSGGIDSGTICGLLHHALGRRVDAISMTYVEDTDYDESRLIKCSVRDHVERWVSVQLSHETLLRDLPLLYQKFDIPLATISIYGYEYLYREAAREGMKVIFTGAGGDYIQAGNYTNFLYALASLKVTDPRRYESELECWIKNHGTSRYPKNRQTAEIFFDRHVFLDQPGVLRPSGISLLDGILDNEFLSHVGTLESPVVPSYGEFLRSYMMQELLYEAVPPGTEAEDVIDWSHGTEMTSPFFCKEMVEFGWRIPLEWKIDKGINKVLARKALRGFCPDEILDRVDKSGFNAPFDLWIRGPIKEFAMDIFLSKRFQERGIYNQKVFHNALNDHMEGKRDHMMLLWQALNLELWLHAWIDEGEGTIK